MLKSNVTTNIQKMYSSGERNFPKQQLRRINLKKAQLQGINLEGSDLTYADLREADLRGANLRRCYLNEANLTGADLTGADLTGAYLLKAYLTNINCHKVILKEAYLTGSFLTKGNFRQANIIGALLNGSHLNGAIFQGASYNHTTRFDRGINPENLGMTKVSSFTSTATQKRTIAEVVTNFEKIAEITVNYLGVTITVKNFENSRPDIEWLNSFSMDKQGKINYQGSLNNKATSLQLKWLEKWSNAFIKKSSLIIHDLPKIIEDKQLSI